MFVFFCPLIRAQLPSSNPFINTARILNACDTTESDFRANKALFEDAGADEVRQIGTFEGGAEIDSTAEFVTLVFYSKHTPKDAAKARVLIEELSAGNAGAARVGAMWLKKRVLDGKMYEEAIAFIQNKSKISEQELLEYYRAAVSAEVDAVVERVMKDIPVAFYSYFREGDAAEGAGKTKVNAIDLVKEYFVYPSKENYEKLLDAVRHFGRVGAASDRGMVRFKAFIRIIDILSPRLRQQLSDDIFKNEGEKDEEPFAPVQ